LVRQLLPDSRFLGRLNALPPPQRVRVTSVIAGRDVLVQPIESARCPFGETIVFDDLGHVELLFRPQVYRSVAAALARPVAAATADSRGEVFPAERSVERADRPSRRLS
jgi:hypothetical protein